MQKTSLITIASGVLLLAGCATGTQNGSPAAEYTATCKTTSEAEIAKLFDRWNTSLQTGDPEQVADNYADNAVLLPTVSNTPRTSRESKIDYFEHFLADGPDGHINSREIHIGCNLAVDSGLYTFTFHNTGDVVQARYSYVYKWDGDDWHIVSHHSSALPEDI